jgi:type II secretory pathway component PulM
VAGKLGARIDDLKSSLERLSPRERMMLGGLGAAFLVGVVVIVGYIILSGLEEIEENNEAMRVALKDLERNRECYLVHRRRTAQLEVRMSRTPLELNRFVETAASAVGVSIAESSEIAPVAVDRYTQRGVEIKLRKITIEQLAKLIKELENSPHIVQITRLNVNTRWNQHEDLDVELVVSTFERRHEPAPDVRRKRGRS